MGLLFDGLGLRIDDGPLEVISRLDLAGRIDVVKNGVVVYLTGPREGVSGATVGV